MKSSIDRYIDALISLEPVFIKAGELALAMQSRAAPRNKYDSGAKEADIVTDADVAVQEFLLAKMLQTPLKECRILAEEKSDLIGGFAKNSPFAVTIDPIDGTSVYAAAGRFFSVIAGFASTKGPLYTFSHYPAFKWTQRICGNKVSRWGTAPDIPIKPGVVPKRTISYSYGEPERVAAEVYRDLTAQGYRFLKRREITEEAGSTTMLYCGSIQGFYVDNPIVFDGLCAYHYGRIKKLKVLSRVDFSRVLQGDHWPYYPGWYIVLNEKE